MRKWLPCRQAMLPRCVAWGGRAVAGGLPGGLEMRRLYIGFGQF